MRTESTTASAITCPHGKQTNVPGHVTLSLAAVEEVASQAAITRWLPSRNADDFPYDALVAEFHRVGKHLVSPALLTTLDRVRSALPQVRGSHASVWLLDRFLDSALDKWDGRYANPTYLGLSLLPLPAVDDLDQDIAAIARQYDRLLVQLVADASRFEIAAADGTTALLPQMRPDVRTTAKRCRLGLQIVGPAARRLGLDDGIAVADPVTGARRLWANLAADLSPAEHRTLQLTMLPVSVIHDEYQFIRVLQSFEATFALVAVQLRAAIEALSDGRMDTAVQRIRAAATTLHEAAPLFSLVGTMQVAAFQAFRVFTEGASAIQSRHYKLVESLCRQPDSSRLESAAYLSVPEVRRRVLARQVTLDEAFTAARDRGRLSARDVEVLEEAMRHFAATLLRWRRTHHRIAVRMLGERTGTGYTEGAPYLAAAQAIPVFTSVAVGEEDQEPEAQGFAVADKIAAAPTGDEIAVRGRCPFAGGAFSLKMTAAAGT